MDTPATAQVKSIDDSSRLKQAMYSGQAAMFCFHKTVINVCFLLNTIKFPYPIEQKGDVYHPNSRIVFASSLENEFTHSVM